ncbi:MAG: hypothetical protein ISS49_02165 [Anaerolineae bacterium]|nr:hypothetical protein [Anaerolineae bacterium]
MKRSEPSLVDFAPYTGRWVASVRGRVAGLDSRRGPPVHEAQSIQGRATGALRASRRGV